MLSFQILYDIGLGTLKRYLQEVWKR